MYIVRNKATQEIIWRNPAPLRQHLKPGEVYHAFDPETMEIGRIEGELPKHWNVDEEGLIRELQLADRVARGLESIPAGQKLEGDHFVPLTPEDRLERGEVTAAALLDETVTQLRGEVESLLAGARTVSGYRLDGLSRAKVGVTSSFRDLENTDPAKKVRLEKRLIYPDAVYDEMEAAIELIGAAYAAAAHAAQVAMQDSPPDVAALRAITVREHVVGNGITFPPGV